MSSQPVQKDPNNLRELRLAANLSEERLARWADISYGTIRRIERGGSPTLTSARKLAAALGVKVEDIWPEIEL